MLSIFGPLRCPAGVQSVKFARPVRSRAMADSKQLFRQLRARREALGLTQEQVAEAVPCGVVALGRWERGIAEPKLVCAIGYGRVLDRYLAVMRGRWNIRTPSVLGISWEAREAASLCRVLQDLRHSSGLRQWQVAEKAGVSQGLIGNIEVGSRRPSISLLIEVLDVYGAHVKWLPLERGRG